MKRQRAISRRARHDRQILVAFITVLRLSYERICPIINSKINSKWFCPANYCILKYSFIGIPFPFFSSLDRIICHLPPLYLAIENHFN